MVENYEDELNEIYQKLNDGDLSVEEALQKSNTLTAEMAAEKAYAKASESFQTTLQDRDAQSLQKEFLKENPDFATLKDSGKLEPFKQQYGGMHDDFSAYFAYKAANPVNMEEVESPSTEVEQTVKPQAPLSDGEIEASMLAAMKRAGEG